VGRRKAVPLPRIIEKIHQRADGTLVFRYDNVPHHPEIVTFPHHKHVGETITAARPPDLSEVLREIDGLLYATQT